MTEEKSAHYKAYQREKMARKCAEVLLEEKSREIFQTNRDLEQQNVRLHRRTTELELLHELISFTQNEVTTFQVLDLFVRNICIKYNFILGNCYMANDQDTEVFSSKIVVCQTDSNFEKKLQTDLGNFQLTKSQTYPGCLLNLETTFYNENLESLTQYPITPTLQAMGALSVYTLTLKIYEEIVAITEFYSKENTIEDSVRALIDTAALQIGTAMGRRQAEKQTRLNYQHLQKAHKDLSNAQAKLVQSEKMASVGQLAAGVAHEINNPIGFIKSNIESLSEYIDTFKNIIQSYESLSDALSEQEKTHHKNHLQAIKSLKEKEDWKFLLKDIDQLLSETKEGTERVQAIVQGLKNFSRVDQNELEETDINECIKITLKMLNSEIKYKADLQLELDQLPLLNCNPGKLNQVFTNLLVNACQAIEKQGLITVKTHASNDNIIIEIGDSGCGIPKEHMKELFTPFFTTKDVGVGTGLGLSISHGIIEEHGGRIEVQSEVGAGTNFSIYLPKLAS